ncbi:MAG: ribonuclease HII [Candidatus Omnitrophica bacterium]|nr:ribonuclease HII [Candidatus Omnitrophota bacterium]
MEQRLARSGCKRICGVDEAGRGPLAGPVVAAAVILAGRSRRLGLIQDSKQLSPKKRELLFHKLMADCEVGVGVVGEAQIDRINILQATIEAMEQAVRALPGAVDCLLIDGPIRLSLKGRQVPVVKGDRISRSIAAASIIAKVTRDRIMRELDRSFPKYGFARHKGYPTRRHRQALARHGPCEIHRMSFGPVKELRVNGREALPSASRGL